MNVEPKYFIGEYYKYPKGDKLFKLVEKRQYTYVFECGKVVFDSVFLDLIRVKTGVQVYKDRQLELVFNS